MIGHRVNIATCLATLSSRPPPNSQHSIEIFSTSIRVRCSLVSIPGSLRIQNDIAVNFIMCRLWVSRVFCSSACFALPCEANFGTRVCPSVELGVPVTFVSLKRDLAVRGFSWH